MGDSHRATTSGPEHRTKPTRPGVSRQLHQRHLNNTIERVRKAHRSIMTTTILTIVDFSFAALIPKSQDAIRDYFIMHFVRHFD